MRGDRHRYRLIPVLCLVTLAGCSTHSTYAPVRDRTHAPQATPGVHVVRSGETLFSIAWQHGLDYRTVAAWNGIRPPYTIHPGQRIDLRGPTAARPAPPPAPPPTTARPAPVTPPPATVGRPAAPPPPAPTGTAVPRWQWPANGTVLRRFDPNATGKKGISIAGVEGAEVRAAAGGQVVYAGSGLVGYGRLIIVKHNDNYLSAYGHNRNLLVKEGDQVRPGQVIAHMGSSGTNRTQLHFEIREKGKPVDPLRHLPRR